MRALVRFLFLLSVLVLVIVGLLFHIERQDHMARFMSSRLGTKVTIEKVSWGLKSLQFQGFRMANPPKSLVKYAFAAEKIDINLSLWKLFLGTTHIACIDIINPTIGIDLYNSSGSRNNWVQIFKNLPETDVRRHFVIDKLTVSNMQFTGRRASGKSLDIPPLLYIEFINMGFPRPLTIGEIGRVIFQTILTTLIDKPHLNKLLNQVPKIPKTLLEETTPDEQANRKILEDLIG